MEKIQESFWLRTWLAWRMGSLQGWIPNTLKEASTPFPDFLHSKTVTSKNMETFFKFFTPGESEFLIHESRGEIYLTNIRLVLLKVEQSSRTYKSINVQDILKLDTTSGAFSITIIVKTKKDETYVFNGLNGSYGIDFRYWNVIIQYAQSENAWQDVKEKLLLASTDEPFENSMILNSPPAAKDVGTKNNNGNTRSMKGILWYWGGIVGASIAAGIGSKFVVGAAILGTILGWVLGAILDEISASKSK